MNLSIKNVLIYVKPHWLADYPSSREISHSALMNWKKGYLICGSHPAIRRWILYVGVSIIFTSLKRWTKTKSGPLVCGLLNQAICDFNNGHRILTQIPNDWQMLKYGLSFMTYLGNIGMPVSLKTLLVELVSLWKLITTLLKVNSATMPEFWLILICLRSSRTRWWSRN